MGKIDISTQFESAIHLADFNAEGRQALFSLFSRFAHRSKDVHVGRNRTVFDMGTYVVKIPRALDGFTDNEWEGSVSNGNDDPEEVRYARTRLAYVDEIPVVFMEKVEYASTAQIVSKLGHEPDWVNSVDCGQVGFTRDGRLVAFDYGPR